MGKDEYMRCSIMSCNKIYHALCTGGITSANPKTWVCPECSCSSKRGGDNSLTPEGATNQPRNDNVTIRRKAARVHIDENQCVEDVHDLISGASQLRSERIKLGDQLSKPSSLAATYELQLELYATILAAYDKKLSESMSVIENHEKKFENLANMMERLVGKLNKCPNCRRSRSADEDQRHSSVSRPNTYALAASARANLLNLTMKGMDLARSTQDQNVASAIAISPERQCGDKKPSSSLKVGALSKSQLKSPCIKARAKQSSLSSVEAESQAGPTKGIWNETTSDKITPPLDRGGLADSQPISTDEPWTEVRRKRPRQLLSMRCVAGPTVTSLKAAEARRHFHLWNMLSGLDEVKAYLAELCPQRVVTVEQLKTAKNYTSFKIGVPEDCYDKCFSVNVWPENARVKTWINFKKPLRKLTDPVHSQSFRGGVGSR